MDINQIMAKEIDERAKDDKDSIIGCISSTIIWQIEESLDNIKSLIEDGVENLSNKQLATLDLALLYSKDFLSEAVDNIK